jgi:hypothetical protein
MVAADLASGPQVRLRAKRADWGTPARSGRWSICPKGIIAGAVSGTNNGGPLLLGGEILKPCQHCFVCYGT